MADLARSWEKPHFHQILATVSSAEQLRRLRSTVAGLEQLGKNFRICTSAPLAVNLAAGSTDYDVNGGRPCDYEAMSIEEVMHIISLNHVMMCSHSLQGTITDCVAQLCSVYSTALEWAARAGDWQMCELLIKVEAKLEAAYDHAPL
jgi:hypothetical protein